MHVVIYLMKEEVYGSLWDHSVDHWEFCTMPHWERLSSISEADSCTPGTATGAVWPKSFVLFSHNGIVTCPRTATAVEGELLDVISLQISCNFFFSQVICQAVPLKYRAFSCALSHSFNRPNKANWFTSLAAGHELQEGSYRTDDKVRVVRLYARCRTRNRPAIAELSVGSTGDWGRSLFVGTQNFLLSKACSNQVFQRDFLKPVLLHFLF